MPRDITQGHITDGHNRKRHLSMQKAPSGVIGGVATVEAVSILVSELGTSAPDVISVIAALTGKRATCGTPWWLACSVVPRVIVAEVLGVVLALLEVFLQPQRHRELHDVVTPNALEDGEPTDVL